LSQLKDLIERTMAQRHPATGGELCCVAIVDAGEEGRLTFVDAGGGGAVAKVRSPAGSLLPSLPALGLAFGLGAATAWLARRHLAV
jgi:hypothetical protein